MGHTTHSSFFKIRTGTYVGFNKTDDARIKSDILAFIDKQK